MRNKTSFGAKRLVILAAVLVTAAVHLFLGLRDLGGPFGLIFVLNGLGFLGLAGLYFLPFGFLNPYRQAVRWALIGFTALTFILYFIFNGMKIDAVSGLTKAAELALIGLLLSERK